MNRLLLILVLLSASCSAQMLQGIVGSGSTAVITTTARSFNGSTQALTNTGTCYLNSAAAFTVAFKFESGNVAQTNQYLLRMTGTTGPHEVGVIYGFVNDGSGHAQIEFFTPNATTSFRTGSQITITDTTTYHTIVYRWAGTGGEWAYFLDGVKTVINAALTSTMGSLAGVCNLEVMRDASGAFANGSLARVIISTAAWSDAQVAAFSSTTCSTSGVSGTVGYWQILGTASPEPESSPSPNTNSLTLVATPPQVTGPTCSGS